MPQDANVGKFYGPKARRFVVTFPPNKLYSLVYVCICTLPLLLDKQSCFNLFMVGEITDGLPVKKAEGRDQAGGSSGMQ